MNRRLYALHRWVSLFAFLQLGIWSASGLAFSLLPEASVKGARVKGAHELPLSGSLEGLRSPGDILAVDSTITGIELRRGPAGPVYLVRAPSGLRRFDARTGEPAPVTEDEAREVARRDQPGRPEIQTLALLTAKPPIEYRDRPLPAWQVQLADPAETMVYIDATSGEVTARRTATWRLYDFLWVCTSWITRDGRTSVTCSSRPPR